MKHAVVFPGQGSQFRGMGKALYERYAAARDLFEKANDILGFRISDLMFEGSEEELKQTRVTQPAIFLHSIVAFLMHPEIKMDMVAGHSLGEFTALVAAGVLSFEDGLQLVAARAQAMQEACGLQPSGMAAVLGMDDEQVERICASIEGETVVAANYNCPGQLVISGTQQGIAMACEKLKAAGARRALPLPVSGAFHSPLMEPAREKLQKAIAAVEFHTPSCPIYQNVNASATTDPTLIREQLIAQLTSPVKWTQTIRMMIADGARDFTEVGPGKVLSGLIQKIDSSVQTYQVQE
ncbi:[acyl-carrier-protein] S-malonyltransferase [Thermoflavifilum aggregans]|uniref:Malonyl CoA-acyl carrier protein transacylase n=1 Tax=Thermoflavifilum aggregans TaxID=454188 RepID=A0A2M9CTC2_9BACT|nr:ACP S-malonyltransferase [Thermoflavifilum aggregans]PJJ75170.1 [acyl-carrier-protein] S-malonyltransferase [Thermoflavifilum aggregans]